MVVSIVLEDDRVLLVARRAGREGVACRAHAIFAHAGCVNCCCCLCCCCIASRLLAHENARNLNYWDSAASFAGEVENPGKTYPRALLACVALVVLCYGLPILVGTGAASVAAAAAAAAAAESGGSATSSGTGGQEGVRWSLWVDGYFAEVGEAVAGRWLGVWIVLAAAAANIGLFEAEMTSDALQVMGMVSDVVTKEVYSRDKPRNVCKEERALSFNVRR